MYEKAANLHIGQQAVGMSTPSEQQKKRDFYIYICMDEQKPVFTEKEDKQHPAELRSGQQGMLE